MKITCIAINWWAKNFAQLLCRSVYEKISESNDFEIILVDNSGELKNEDFIEYAPRILKPGGNLGHGNGLDFAIDQAKGDYIMILDIDAHILLKDWDVKLLELFKNKVVKLACATDGGLLKPARPLAMFFEKKTIVDNSISFQAVNHDGVKFDVGIHAYFKILTIFGDKSVVGMPSKNTEFKDVLGNEYLLKGERFVYHNWWGTRWYNVDGLAVHQRIDNVNFEDFKRKKDNLFKQV